MQHENKHQEASGNDLGGVEALYTKKKNTIVIAGVAIIAVVAIIIGVKYFYLEPQEKEAAEKIFVAQQFFAIDSFSVALNGGGDFDGFSTIANDYSFTKTGDLAKFYAGICELNMGNAAGALEYFNETSMSDPILSIQLEGLKGDACSQMGDLDKAVSFYKKAVEKDNSLTTAYYAYKMGLVFEKKGDLAKALESYTLIKNGYPTSPEGRNINGAIARVNQQLN